MKIFCLYGVGLPTERAYHYKRNWNSDDVPFKNSPRNISEPAIIIDAAYKSSRTNTTFGIRYSDGDGSVPLLSLGYICADAWQRPETRLNPSRTAVYTREYIHKAEFQVDDPMRGGPASCDHVDILGNAAMIEDFIKVATGFEVGTVEQDNIVSKIRDIAAAINAHPSGGLGRQCKGPWPLPWKR
jgi:phospholipid:diacylglycerol acyltransferase